MSRRTRVMIVVGDAQARVRLRRLLAAEPRVELVGEAATVPEARLHARAGCPDLMFLDIRLPGDSLALLASLECAEHPAVIFTSPLDQRAVRAFEVHAADYLLEPFDADRVRAALERVRPGRATPCTAVDELQLRGIAAELRGEQPFLERFVVRDHGRLAVVEAGEVDWIEAAGNHVRVHVGEVRHLMRETLNSLETRLDPRRFARIHREVIVRVGGVARVRPLRQGDFAVELADGTRLTMSRDRRAALAVRGPVPGAEAATG